jgi:outer membrane lipoprotein-sorting protein
MDKTFIPALALVLTAYAFPAGAADAASAPAATAQQSKMGDCSAQFKATGKPGGERQSFMKECLKKDSDAKSAQNNRMKQCSADFKKTGKPGKERQAYMKECLSSKS